MPGMEVALLLALEGPGKVEGKVVRTGIPLTGQQEKGSILPIFMSQMLPSRSSMPFCT